MSLLHSVAGFRLSLSTTQRGCQGSFAKRSEPVGNSIRLTWCSLQACIDLAAASIRTLASPSCCTACGADCHRACTLMPRRSNFRMGTELSQIEGAEKHSFDAESGVRRSSLIARRRFCCSSHPATRPANQRLTVDDDPGRFRSSDHFMYACYHILSPLRT